MSIPSGICPAPFALSDMHKFVADLRFSDNIDTFVEVR